MSIYRFDPMKRYSSIKAMTIQEYAEQQKRAKQRKAKRIAKRRELGLGPTRTTVRAQLDHLWSLAVRRRDRKTHAGFCRVCMVKIQLGFRIGSPRPAEVAYHIVPRGDDMTRWLLSNGVAACSQCNWGELQSRTRTSTKAHYRALHAAMIGERELCILESLAKQTANFSLADLIELREKLKAIAEGRNG